ncbi:MAG: serine dehydratase subunit alpha family protein [Lachnospiraceae bacterium]|nr:serine dehydratase subunit alpha family protein [Lachnospiraceae bacterium]
MTQDCYDNYSRILRSELIPAMGCTEPIAIALAAAKAREVLGCLPEKIVARCSGNIIKNVKSVTVPNSGGEHGIEAAAVLGAVAGRADLNLQVISEVSEEEIRLTKELLLKRICSCELEEGRENLYILITVSAGEETASVELKNRHDHISRITKNGEVVFEQPEIRQEEKGDKSRLNLKDIMEYADTVDLDEIRDLLETQISYNSAISEEGLTHRWGAGVGRTILDAEGAGVLQRARAAAAAGSDARMNGCPMPVVINSGSGNQGITCTMPVLTYAKALGCSHEKLLRALTLSNLVSLHQKRYIGNLSAYCGAVSAATGAACGIAYLQDADYDTLGRTIINSIGTTGGIICDGAKSSCASKISAAVEAGILGYEMAKRGEYFRDGEGIVSGDYEQTIRNIGCVGRDGMKSTDITILNLMIS